MGVQPAMVSPPLTLITWPVMNDAAGEAKKSTGAATSSGRASRRNGIALTRASFNLSGCAWKSGVSVGPGHTAFTVIRYLSLIHI